jgi:peptide/nickel transport system substrate-binding protein
MSKLNIAESRSGRSALVNCQSREILIMALSRRILGGAAAAFLLQATPSFAETVFRLDASAPGEADPDKGIDYIGSVLAFNLYDGLVAPGQNGAPVAPHLASAWTIDGNDYVFTLRPDVKFHSGNVMTADDVVFSFQRLMALGKGNSPLFAGRVADVVAVDPQTVKFTLSGPYAPFLGAMVRLPVLDSKLVLAHKADGKFGDMGDYGEAYLSSHDAGSGAYTLVSHVPESETNLATFDGYFLGVPASAPDKVRIRYGLQPATVRELVASGQQDMTSQWLPPEVMRALADRPDTHLLTDRGSNILFLHMNTQKPPLDDVNCRLALTYGFDYATAIKLAQITDKVSAATPANGPIGKSEFGYNASLPNFAQDLGKARDALAKCKYKTPDERKLDSTWITEVPAEEKIALLMKADFDALGFQTTIKGAPWTLYTQEVTNPESTPSLSEVYIDAPTPDPDSILYNMYSSKSPPTWESASHLSDAEVNGLLDAGRKENDIDKRRAIYEQLEARLDAVAPAIFASEVSGVFVGLNTFKLPPFEDDSKRFSAEEYGLQFRLVEMTK